MNDLERWYLPTSYIYYYVIPAMALLAWMELWPQIFMVLVVGLLWLFRKSDPGAGDGDHQVLDLVKSPVNGKVTALRREVEHSAFGRGLTELVMAVPHGYEMGLYLPISGEIEAAKGLPLGSCATSSQEHFRYKKGLTLHQKKVVYSGASLMVRGEAGQVLGLEMIKCFLGLTPRIWVLPGDRGRAGMRFGYFPLGGSVLCYLPSAYQVTCRVGERVVAGENVIAIAHNGQSGA